MARLLGPEIMAAFANPDVTEVYVNTDGRVWLDTRTEGTVCRGLLNSGNTQQFLNEAATHVGGFLTPQTPRLRAELPQRYFNGARLQGFVPPASAAPAFVVRKPTTEVVPLDLRVQDGTITPEQRAIFREAVLQRWNILIAGGMNTGKTSLAASVTREIADLCPKDRLLILEDTTEIQCAASDHLSLRSAQDGSWTLEHLVMDTLRTRANRILVGEVRGPEALYLLDAWQTGHPGGVATVHATTVTSALKRMNLLARRAVHGEYHDLVGDAVDLVVLIKGGNEGGRRVSELVRCRRYDAARGRYLLKRLGNGAQSKELE